MNETPIKALRTQVGNDSAADMNVADSPEHVASIGEDVRTTQLRDIIRAGAGESIITEHQGDDRPASAASNHISLDTSPIPAYSPGKSLPSPNAPLTPAPPAASINASHMFASPQHEDVRSLHARALSALRRLKHKIEIQFKSCEAMIQSLLLIENALLAFSSGAVHRVTEILVQSEVILPSLVAEAPTMECRVLAARIALFWALFRDILFGNEVTYNGPLSQQRCVNVFQTFLTIPEIRQALDEELEPFMCGRRCAMQRIQRHHIYTTIYAYQQCVLKYSGDSLYPVIVSLHDSNKEILLRNSKAFKLKGHVNPITCMLLYNDVLLTGCSDGSFKLWNVDTLKEIRCFTPHRKAITALCISIDSGNGFVSTRGASFDIKQCNARLFTSSSDNTIRVFALPSLCELKCLRHHLYGVTSIVIIDDKLYSASMDGSLRVWDANTYELNKDVFVLDHEDSINLLVSVNHNTQRSVNSTSSNTCEAGSMLATVMNSLGRNKRHASSSPSKSGGAGNQLLTYLVSAGRNGVVKLRSPVDLAVMGRIHTHVVNVPAIVFSDQCLFTCFTDNSCTVYSRHTLEQITSLRGHKGLVTALQMHDNLLFTGFDDGTILLWDLAERSIVAEFKDHSGAITSIVILGPRMFASSSDNDASCRLYV
jgi:WD40 repeat protein